jgi:hypothetical protein
LHTTFVQAGYKLFRNTWKNSFDTVLVLSDILWTDVTLAVVEIPSLNIGCSRDSFRGFARVAPRAQERSSITRLPVDYEGDLGG